MQIIPFVGYLSASIAFVLLALLLFTAWRGKWEGGSLLLAVLISVVWAGTAAYYTFVGKFDFMDILVLELLRDVAWILFLLTITYQRKQAGSRYYIFTIFIPISTLIVVAVLLIFGYAQWVEEFENHRVLFDLQILPFLLLSVLGVVLVEQVFRNTSQQHIWTVKYLCFGLGGMFIYDIYLFANALLIQGLDVISWAARGYVNVLIVPLIAISAARNPHWSVDIYVSRKFVFHSATLMACGIYLIFMAVGAYYISRMGGEWAQIGQLIFLFGSGIVLVAILFSGQIRAQIKVYLSKHFFNYRYDYREEWATLINTLSNAALDSDIKKTVIRSMARIVESPSGQLWLKSKNGEYRCAATASMEMVDTISVGDNLSLIDFLDRKKWVVDIDEYNNYPQQYQELELPAWLKRINNPFLIVPLLAMPSDDNATIAETSNNEQIHTLTGFILLTRPMIQLRVNWEVRDLLLMVGRQCANYLELLRMNEELVASRQFEAFNRLSAYVVHDLKNIVAQLSLVSSNAQKFGNNPEFVKDAFATIKYATDKMSRMLAQLRNTRLETVNYVNAINLRTLLQTVVNERGPGDPSIELNFEVEHDCYTLGDADRLSAVFSHLIQNAQDATPMDGEIRVSLEESNGQLKVEIRDTGCGMDTEFVKHKLFRPFVTTKGNAGMGIGAYESKEFIESIGGSISVDSQPGLGSVFTIYLNQHFIS